MKIPKQISRQVQRHELKDICEKRETQKIPGQCQTVKKKQDLSN